MPSLLTRVSVEAGQWVRFGPAAAFRGPGPFAASAEGFDVVIVNTAEGPRAYQGRCPHQGALLGEGELLDGMLVCRNHGWQFDAATGARRGGRECLASYPVEVRGDELWICMPPRAATQPPPGPLRRLEDLPGPRGWPLLGNLPQIDLRRFHLVLERWAERYGPLYTYRMARHRVLASADPALNERILRDRPDTFRRAAVVAPVFEEMGVAGVFSAEGLAWQPQRRLAMHALSQRQLRTFYPALREITLRLLARWHRLAATGEPVDVIEELKRFTVDVTTRLVFSHDVNTIEQDGDRIQQQLELIFPTFNRRLFAPVPTWRWLRLPADRRVELALAAVRAWLAPRIDEARARLAADPSLADRPENFLQAMLATRAADGRPFPDEVIFGNAMTMLLAGEDTTAFTLGWAVHHLCDAPAAVAALRAEAESMRSPDGVAPDLESAGALEYAGAVANEAMRLRPVAPLLILENTRDVVLADVAVPAGTWLALLLRPPVLREDRFAAAASFRPERWLAGAAKEPGAHDAGAHMPFGSGPRICPGRSLALLEMKVLLSAIYRAFDVERMRNMGPVEETFAFTMSPTALRVRLRRRRLHGD